ncbi:hypothetical protein PRIPAC_84027 [Pristionchus pacificus]|uniref:Uncharacterized protein n=1 Tax=Pristionchus pacificus TaxID=54126 RepID=A0A2A6BSK1_PRIPA|nr:hypothetical protein PRIPAC_84027 [Pristionchus pacificus]|eukprot:PDM68870.1 hypothetical protein PRIPAC_47172 [Pristionchus pacificus]
MKLRWLLLLLVSTSVLADELEGSFSDAVNVESAVSSPLPTAEGVTTKPELEAVLAEWGIDSADVKQEVVNDSEDSVTAANEALEGSGKEPTDAMLESQESSGKIDILDGSGPDSVDWSELGAISEGSGVGSGAFLDAIDGSGLDLDELRGDSDDEDDEDGMEFQSARGRTPRPPPARPGRTRTTTERPRRTKPTTFPTHSRAARTKSTTSFTTSKFSRAQYISNKTITHSTSEQHSSTLSIKMKTRDWPDRYTPQGPFHTKHSSFKTVKLTTKTPSFTTPTTTKPTNQVHTNYERSTTKRFDVNTDDRTVKLTTATPSVTKPTTEKMTKTDDAVKDPSKTAEHKAPIVPHPKIDDTEEETITKRVTNTTVKYNSADEEEIERLPAGSDRPRESAGGDDDEDDEEPHRVVTRRPPVVTTTKKKWIDKIVDGGMNLFTGGCHEAKKEVNRKGGYDNVDPAVQAKYMKCIEEEGTGLLGTVKDKVVEGKKIKEVFTGTATTRRQSVPREPSDYDNDLDRPRKGGRPKEDTDPEDRDERTPVKNDDYPEDKDESEAGDRKERPEDDYDNPKDKTAAESSEDKDDKETGDGKEPSDDYEDRTPKEDEDKAPKPSEDTDEKEDGDRKDEGDDASKDDAKPSEEDDNDKDEKEGSDAENDNAEEKDKESKEDEPTEGGAGIESDAPKDEEVDSKDASDPSEENNAEKPEVKSEGSGTDELDDVLAQLDE